MGKIKVGILGATGVVGQRFIRLLENHPWFEVVSLSASEKSLGKTYYESVKDRWLVGGSIPNYVRNLIIEECKPNMDCKIVFSALDSSIAGEIEKEFAERGYIVVSNSRNHRMDEDVPLLIPEVNQEHLELIKNKTSFIITNPNCSVTGLILALAPLHKKFRIKKIFVTTMQAISGAGYPGVASLEILDNVIPYIAGEEEKIESEPLKILGKLENGKIKFADIKITAHCNRVNVSDGHLESVSFELEKKAEIEEIEKEIINFNPLKELNLPTAPKYPVILMKENNRPQPKYDRNEGNGMSCTIGRIRKCNILDYKVTILSHNTIRGAAGGAILNAEI
ncbi:MAG: aspartate-semialdehyde dehydrogenase, partial [Planctomycetota bacterium]